MKKYADQFIASGSITVAATPAAVTVKLGWKPRYIMAVNINDDIKYEYLEGMADASALKSTNNASTQFSIITTNGFTLTDDGFTIGTAIGDTAADVVRYVAFR